MFIKLSIALQRAWWYLQNPLILYFQKRNVYHMRRRVLREEGVKRVINNIMKRLLEFASQIHFLGQVTSFKIMDFLHDSFFRSQNHIFTWQLINVYLLFHDYFVSPSLTEKDSCKRQLRVLKVRLSLLIVDNAFIFQKTLKKYFQLCKL